MSAPDVCDIFSLLSLMFALEQSKHPLRDLMLATVVEAGLAIWRSPYCGDAANNQVYEMKNKVIIELCAFLNAFPQQIRLWDKKVVDFLVKHPDIFAKFQDGCHYTKWDIYQSIKYG